jgi:hypothetical protein
MPPPEPHRTLHSLRQEVLGFGGECYVDPWGRPYCDHDHTAAEPPLEDIYEKVQGWTAQSPTGPS